MPDALDFVWVEWPSTQEALLAVRCAVFVDEQGVPESLEVDEHDPKADHLCVYQAGIPVATGRLLNDGHVGRLAVLKSHRGQGIGTQIMAELINRARAKQLLQVTLNAQCTAEGFYQRLGFTVHGDVFDDAGIPHREMVLPL